MAFYSMNIGSGPIKQQKKVVNAYFFYPVNNLMIMITYDSKSLFQNMQEKFKEDLMQIIISLLLSTLAVLIATYILPGVHVSSFFTALVVAVVLGIVNAFILPLLLLITLPINILTLGLFTLVIIGFLVMGVAAIVPGFTVDGFWWALLLAVVLFIINSFINAVV